MNNKEANVLYLEVKKLLELKGLDIWFLEFNLTTNYIRGSWKWGQKRNKTSSTVQLIDNFNYLNYIPDKNKQYFKEKIVIKCDLGRSQQTNYKYALIEWMKILKKYFTLSKKRTINIKLEEKRKEQLKNTYQEKNSNQKYRNRYF